MLTKQYKKKKKVEERDIPAVGRKLASRAPEVGLLV